MKTSKCPKCDRRWPWVSEQAAAIKVFGHCIVCHAKAEEGYDTGDVRDLVVRLDEDGIITESKRREKSAGYGIEPCPVCVFKIVPTCPSCKGIGSVRVPLKESQDSDG